MTSPATTDMNNFRRSMELFSLSTAILTVAALLFLKIGVWVPLIAIEKGLFYAIPLALIYVAGGAGVGAFALYGFVLAFREYFSDRWQKICLGLTALVMGGVIFGGILEINHTAEKTIAEMREVQSGPTTE